MRRVRAPAADGQAAGRQAHECIRLWGAWDAVAGLITRQHTCSGCRAPEAWACGSESVHLLPTGHPGKWPATFLVSLPAEACAAVSAALSPSSLPLSASSTSAAPACFTASAPPCCLSHRLKRDSTTLQSRAVLVMGAERDARRCRAPGAFCRAPRGTTAAGTRETQRMPNVRAP